MIVNGPSDTYVHEGPFLFQALQCTWCSFVTKINSGQITCICQEVLDTKLSAEIFKKQ